MTAKRIICTVFCVILSLSIAGATVFAVDYTSSAEKALQFIDSNLKQDFTLPDTSDEKLNANIYTAYSVYALNSADKYDYLIPADDSLETVDALTKTILVKSLQDKSADLSAYGEKLLELQSADGGFVNSADVETTVATSFAAIALGLTGKTEGNSKIVEYLTSKMLSDGGFNDYDSISNVDNTGMVMWALSSIKNSGTTTADSLLQKCAAYLKSTENADGFYVGKGQYDSANSCSQSYGLIGLIVAGATPSDKAVSALLSLQDENGGFWYDTASKSETGYYNAPDFISTYESAMALNVISGENLWLSVEKSDETTITTTESATEKMTVSATDTVKESNPDDVATGEQPFNPWFVVILVVAIIVVVIALIPTIKKKK